ncbi:MAG: hypothetical protein WCT36_00820 [Candidatus Gracilibacteria bacterium]|jgi:hypothetical protein
MNNTFKALGLAAIAAVGVAGCEQVDDIVNCDQNGQCTDTVGGEDGANGQDTAGPDTNGGEDGTGTPDLNGSDENGGNDSAQEEAEDDVDDTTGGTHGAVLDCMDEKLATWFEAGAPISSVFGGTESEVRAGQMQILDDGAGTVGVSFEAKDAGQNLYEGFMAEPNSVIKIQHPMTEGADVAGGGVRVYKITVEPGYMPDQADIQNAIQMVEAATRTGRPVAELLETLKNGGLVVMVEEQDFGAEFDNPNGVITITTSGDAQMVVIQTTFGCDFVTALMDELHKGRLNELGKQVLFASVFTTGDDEKKAA